MAQNTKPCITCGQEFRPCPRCEERKADYESQYGFAPWRTVACCVECYQIYDVLRRVNYGQLTMSEAQAMLRNIEIPQEIKHPEVQELIDKVLSHKEAPVEYVSSKKRRK